jgi:hypothetical protein
LPPLLAYQPEGLMAAAIFVVVSTVSFGALVKTDIGVWWSLLFAAVTGVTVLALMAAYGYLADLIERLRERRKRRPGGPTHPDIP